jgi:hypothetical protein
MKLLATSVTSLSLLALVLAPADQTPAQSGEPVQALEITRNGSQVPTKGPAESFTGSVRIDPLFAAREPRRDRGTPRSAGGRASGTRTAPRSARVPNAETTRAFGTS